MIDPLMFIALLPAVVLVVYIYRKDRTDKEPPALLAKLLGYGALSCLPAIVVELILSAVIERLNVRNVCLGYFLEAFVVAGLTEETCKFLFLRTTWRSPAFDYQFDAIVYAVMVALGFAAFENVKYVYSSPPASCARSRPCPATRSSACLWVISTAMPSSPTTGGAMRTGRPTLR